MLYNSSTHPSYLVLALTRHNRQKKGATIIAACFLVSHPQIEYVITTYEIQPNQLGYESQLMSLHMLKQNNIPMALFQIT
jgi:hypothetical protein